MRRLILVSALFGALSVAYCSAEEPICGKWQMIYMKVGDMKDMPKPVPALKISQSGTSLHFEYMTGLEGKVFRSFKAHMDGTPADIVNDKGERVGTAKLSKNGSTYTLTMQTPNGEPEPGKVSLSQDKKILTIESEAHMPDRSGTTRVIQQFAHPGVIPN